MKELDLLLEGNKRYIENAPKPKDLRATRMANLEGQKPFVTIVSCSDSRVVPEYIFDASIGELFIVRLAGNIVDSCALGSVEYGVEHLHTPLLVVMGHEKCGAVTAACKLVHEMTETDVSVRFGEHSKQKNNIDFVIEKIKPAIGRVGREDVEHTIEENIRCTMDYMKSSSHVIKELVEKGKLKVVGMKYSFSTGKVDLIE